MNNVIAQVETYDELRFLMIIIFLQIVLVEPIVLMDAKVVKIPFVTLEETLFLF